MPRYTGLSPRRPDSNRAPPTCLWSKEFYETDAARGFVRGYTFQFAAAPGRRGGGRQRGGGPCRGARGTTAPSVGSTAADSPVGVCEDLPEEHNRVTLDPVLKDCHGIPAPKIDYALGDNTAA